ncbi:MAG: 16S rRNA (adenine(1518)-N(6)/adenine(1519)-N(6))-dimethyltransferase [Bacteroidales bacterium]|jgi:16S rRNA (adenine1518-N6/adenine1519-N6)-dimethyltransferase|nr:16S rRNA (adenine(1518)-N(6)/adenine(1519)-N(6))-dimethyltransferase [Bacteroidales bacterium]
MIRPKKHLGQHFLRDENIARKIVGYLNPELPVVLEIGPGMGVLSKYLLHDPRFDPWFMEVDQEAISWLNATFPQISNRLITADFLKFDLSEFPPWIQDTGYNNQHPPTIIQHPVSSIQHPESYILDPASRIGSEATVHPASFSLIGNFPYNISSQILFKVLEHRHRVKEVIGMFQKEVAERVCAPPGNKTYGILSVLLQAFFEIDYLFTVNETVFYPPPRVKSAVIRLRRNNVLKLGCDEALFSRVVKTAFNQRRKTLRNALRSLIGGLSLPEMKTIAGLLDLRAERLTVNEFIVLTQVISDKIS